MGGRSITERVHHDPGIGARHRAIHTDRRDRIVPEPRGCFLPRKGANWAIFPPDSARNRMSSGSLPWSDPEKEKLTIYCVSCASSPAMSEKWKSPLTSPSSSRCVKVAPSTRTLFPVAGMP